MSRAINSMLLVRLGIVLLGLTSFLHLFEHWETTALEKCLAQCEHSHASSDSEDTSPTDHHHGCSPHEHSPAILQTSQPFLPQPIVLASPEIRVMPPPPVPRKIDQPPRIS